MKRLNATLCIIAMCLCLTGCGNFSTNKDEIVRYRNITLAKLTEYETIVTGAYNTILGEHYSNDSIVYEVITNTILPTINEWEKESQNLIFVNSQLKDVHAIYIKYIHAIKNGVIALMAGIEQQDRTQFITANEYLDQSEEYAKSFAKELAALEKHYLIIAH